MDQLPVIWTAAQCGFTGWQDIWGDPWLIGTILVVAYAVTGILLLRTARLQNGREHTLWKLCGAVLVFQAFNTPLDLHAFVWTFGKCLAKAQGWYGLRQQVQEGVLVGLLGFAALLILLCTFFFRRNILGNLFLITGITIAIGSTGIKGIGMHELAHYYAQTLGPLYIADWIELAGIMIAFLAMFARRRALARAANEG